MSNKRFVWLRWLIFATVWIACIVLFTHPALRTSSQWFYLFVGSIFVIGLGIRLRKSLAATLEASSWQSYFLREVYELRLLKASMSDALTWLRYQTRALIFIVTLASLYWMYRSADLLRPGSTRDAHKTAAYCFAAGVLVAGIAAILAWRSITPPASPNTSLTPGHSNWILTALGILALWALAEGNGHLLKIKDLHPLSTTRQLILLFGGILVLVWGLGGGGWPRRLPKINYGEWVVVTLLTLLALVLRVYHLDTSVRHLVDELNFATYSTYFKNDAYIPLLRPEVRGFPAIYSYFIGQTIAIWGRNLIGLRLPSAILGTLTVPALYLLARSLFDRKTAFIAAALLAVFPPHIHHSRLALNNIVDPLFGTLAFAFLARGLRTNHRVDFAAGGAALGLTQYFYEGGRLLYPPLTLVWLAFGLIVWQPRPSFKGLLIAAFAAIIVAAPIYYTLHALDLPSTPRLQSEALTDNELSNETAIDRYLRHLRFSFLAYTTQPEWVAFYYGGQNGLILSYLVPTCLLGLAFVFWRFYTPAILLLLWILTTTLSNGFLRVNVLSTRFEVVFPAITLLMAVGLRYTAEFLWQPRLPIKLQNVLLGLLVGMFMIGQAGYYFGPHLDFYNEQIRHQWPYDGEDALYRAADLPAGTTVYIVSNQAIDPGYAVGIIKFLHDDMAISFLSPSDITLRLLRTISRSTRNAFFIEPNDARTRYLLQVYFETLEGPFLSPYKDLPVERQLLLFYAPGELPAEPDI